jgi:hypothetical protein
LTQQQKYLGKTGPDDSETPVIAIMIGYVLVLIVLPDLPVLIKRQYFIYFKQRIIIRCGATSVVG